MKPAASCDCSSCALVRVLAILALTCCLVFCALAVAPSKAYAATKPGTPTISKVAPYSKTKLKVTIRKVSGVTGYQVKYSESKSLKKAKTVSSTSTAVKVTGLEAGKKYYVKVRAYKNTSSGKIFYGSWSKMKSATTYTYGIAYKLNGGKWSSVTPRYGFYKSSKTFSLKVPTRVGYSFKGWYSSSKFSGSKVTQIKKGTSKSKTLYAKWSPKIYSITYDLADGKQAENQKTSYKITTATFSLKSPSKTGYAFSGWYNADGKKVTNIAKGSYGNKVLTARWTPRTYSITYNLDDGVQAADQIKTYKITDDTFELKDPTREGFIFAGWYTSNSFKTRVTSIKQGSIGDKTLWAKWEEACPTTGAVHRWTTYKLYSFRGYGNDIWEIHYAVPWYYYSSENPSEKPFLTYLRIGDKTLDLNSSLGRIDTTGDDGKASSEFNSIFHFVETLTNVVGWAQQTADAVTSPRQRWVDSAYYYFKDVGLDYLHCTDEERAIAEERYGNGRGLADLDLEPMRALCEAMDEVGITSDYLYEVSKSVWEAGGSWNNWGNGGLNFLGRYYFVNMGETSDLCSDHGVYDDCSASDTVKVCLDCGKSEEIY